MKYITIITIIVTIITIIVILFIMVVDEIRRQRKINNKLKIEQDLSLKLDKIEDKIKKDFYQQKEDEDE